MKEKRENGKEEGKRRRGMRRRGKKEGRRKEKDVSSSFFVLSLSSAFPPLLLYNQMNAE